MAKGGKRAGAGRKKAQHTIEKEKAREYIIQRVVEELEPLMNVLIRNAKKGSLHAVTILFERAFGRTPTGIELPLGGKGELIYKWDDGNNYPIQSETVDVSTSPEH